MDSTTLESSIRKESEERIADVLEKEAAEMKRLDEEYAAELEHFRQKIETETQARIDQELSRVENRAVLERKKMALASMENFINRMVDDVMKQIRQNPGYRPFLVDAARHAVTQISGSVEVRLNPEDMVMEKDIRMAILSAGNQRNVEIKADKSIGWGGLVIVDEAAGRVFNHTLERRYFRRAGLVRRRALKILQDGAGRTKGKEPFAQT